jgi:beta-N-acetylhexosaminidase
MRSKRAAFFLVLSCAGAALTSSACATSRLASLDLEEKAAQVLLIGVEGAGMPSAESEALLERMPVGGVVLFSFNLPGEPADAARYTAALQAASARGWGPRNASSGRSRSGSPIPLIVAIDHEGGSVFRFKGEGITHIPPASEVGERGARYASLLGHAAGAELRALGFNMALAPVVELLTDENKSFLGSRSYGRSGKQTDAAAGAYIEGLQAERVAAVAKHFPGNAGADPHKVLPELRLSRRDYDRDYLPRFASAMRRGVSSVMLSHVVFTAIDPERPASLSPALVRGELRRRLGFRGVAITDDLGMRALTATSAPEKSAVEALSAGADLLMLVDMREAPGVRDAIAAAVKDGRLPAARLDEAVRRVLALKSRFKMDAALDTSARAEALAAFPGIVRENAMRLRAFRDAPMINK